MDEFEWDEAKNAANRSKHGIDFDLIYRFDWSRAKIRSDHRFDYGERRFLAYGRIEQRGYAVVFVRRGEKIRIISVRPMHEKEARSYGL